MLRFNCFLVFSIHLIYAYFNTSYVKVQHYTLQSMPSRRHNFNTSYVKVQPVAITRRCRAFPISIHPMLRFNKSGPRRAKWQNIHFNTSYVKVQQRKNWVLNITLINFNTSYVKVQHSRGSKGFRS